jgi:hypothetical protein
MPRTNPRKASKSAAPRPPVYRCTFICTACEAVEHTPTPALPKGWATETIGNDIFAYCPDDAIDLPRQGSVQ